MEVDGRAVEGLNHEQCAKLIVLCFKNKESRFLELKVIANVNNSRTQGFRLSDGAGEFEGEEEDEEENDKDYDYDDEGNDEDVTESLARLSM